MFYELVLILLCDSIFSYSLHIITKHILYHTYYLRSHISYLSHNNYYIFLNNVIYFEWYVLHDMSCMIWLIISIIYFVIYIITHHISNMLYMCISHFVLIWSFVCARTQRIISKTDVSYQAICFYYKGSFGVNSSKV